MTSNDLTPSASLVKFAHLLAGMIVTAGDIVIDATLGNGHDTLFLLERIKPDGHVYGFDIQQAAIDVVTRRLQQAGEADCATLLLANHALMAECVPPLHRGRIKLVMFNLGYMPGSNKEVKTCAKSTVAALNAAISLLSPDGMVTVMAYPGHPEGDTETQQVGDWCGRLDPAQYSYSLHENHPENPKAPKLFIVNKIG